MRNKMDTRQNSNSKKNLKKEHYKKCKIAVTSNRKRHDGNRKRQDSNKKKDKQNSNRKRQIVLVPFQ